MGLGTEIGKRPWSQEDIETLRLLMDEGLDPVDIALRLNRTVQAVRSKMSSLQQALLLKERAAQAGLEDEAKLANGPVMVYRLLDPLTDEEAFALGLCLPEAEKYAKLFGVSDSFATAVAKVERAVGAR